MEKINRIRRTISGSRIPVPAELIAPGDFSEDRGRRAVSVQVQIAGSREWRLVAPVGFQETQVRGLLTAEEPPLVEDHGPRPDGEDQQDQEDDLGDQSQGG